MKIEIEVISLVYVVDALVAPGPSKYSQLTITSGNATERTLIMANYKVSRKEEYRRRNGETTTELVSTHVDFKDLSLEALQKDDVFSLTAFTDDSKVERDRLIAKMTVLRDSIGWSSEVTHKAYESKTYGKGYAITVMKRAVAPRVTEDDMDAFIASLAGNASI